MAFKITWTDVNGQATTEEAQDANSSVNRVRQIRSIGGGRIEVRDTSKRLFTEAQLMMMAANAGRVKP